MFSLNSDSVVLPEKLGLVIISELGDVTCLLSFEKILLYFHYPYKTSYTKLPGDEKIRCE